MEDTIIVSYVYPTNDDVPVLVVGRKRRNESLEIVNAFQGEEASNIYAILTTKKEKNNE